MGGMGGMGGMGVSNGTAAANTMASISDALNPYMQMIQQQQAAMMASPYSTMYQQPQDASLFASQQAAATAYINQMYSNPYAGE